MLAVLNPLQ